MAVTTALPKWAALPRINAQFGPLLLLATSIVLFAASRRLVSHVGRWDETFTAFLIFFIFAIAFAFRSVTYESFTPVLRLTARGVGWLVFFQVLFDSLGPFPPSILFAGDGHALFFRWTALLAIGCGVAAYWRPAFLVPLLLFYVGWRELVGLLSGVEIVATDYLGMVDVGYFCVLGMLLFVMVRTILSAPWARTRFPGMPTMLLGGQDWETLRVRLAGLLWSCAVGAHLGSYFWSGIAKLRAGGDAPWTWLLQNPTQTSIVIGLERGDNPLATWPWLVQHVWDAIAAGGPFLNAFVLGAQLLSPLAGLSTRLLSVLCLLFDVFHIGVYFTLGALFFFWIAMNLIIVAGAHALPRGGFTTSMKVTMIVSTVAGNLFFYTNHLGWLDSAKLASPQFYAETQDGSRILIPSNFFGIYSYSIAQGKTYIPENHFKFRIGGNNLDRQSWDDARNCGPETVKRQDENGGPGTIVDLVQSTDSFMREHPAIKDMNLYYIYPHHMLPNPFVFRRFNDLAMDDIVAYHYTIDSVCLSLKDGKLQRDVRKTSDMRIDVH